MSATHESWKNVSDLPVGELKALLLKGRVDLDPEDWVDISQPPPENKTIFNPDDPVVVEFAVSRYGDMSRQLTFAPNTTWGEVYQKIYQYLNEYELTEDDIQEFCQKEVDFEDYLDENSKTYHWIDFIGGAFYFEGFCLDLAQKKAYMSTGS